MIENFDVDQSQTADRARDVVQKIRRMMSDQRYSETGRRLDVRWRPRFQFNAYAGIDPLVPDNHMVVLNEGAPRVLQTDATGFATICERHFTLPYYTSLFDAEIFNYGQSRGAVLPDGLSSAQVADQMFRLSMAWLYLHEQGHLFQQHALLDGEIPDVRLAKGAGFEMIGESEGPTAAARLTGKDAIRSHILELAADAEATSLVGQLLVYVGGGTISRGTTWTFICGLMCMFQLFYGRRELRPCEAVGSHPDPSFRMRMALKQLMGFLLHPKVQTRAPWATNATDIQRLFDHATMTASAYWTIRIQDVNRVNVPDFFANVVGYEATLRPYAEAMLASWNEISNRIKSQYFGWGDELAFDPDEVDFFL
jgi:hypothetical protein